MGVELKDLQAQNAEKEKKLEQARQAEVEIRRSMRKLKEQARTADIELTLTLGVHGPERLSIIVV